MLWLCSALRSLSALTLVFLWLPGPARADPLEVVSTVPCFDG